MANKLGTTTITIDEEVYRYLTSRKRLGQRDSLNSVLRRILNLGNLEEKKVP